MTYTEANQAEGIPVPFAGRNNVEETYAVFYPYDGLPVGGYESAQAAGDFGIQDVTDNNEELRGARAVKVTIEAL